MKTLNHAMTASNAVIVVDEAQDSAICYGHHTVIATHDNDNRYWLTSYYDGVPVFLIALPHDAQPLAYDYLEALVFAPDARIVAFAEYITGELAEGATEAFESGHLSVSVFYEYEGDGHDTLDYIRRIWQAAYNAKAVSEAPTGF